MATRGAYGTTEQNARRILDSLAAKGLIDPRKNYAQDDREDTALNQLQGLMTLAKQTAQFHEEDGRPLGDATLFNALAAEGIAPNAELAGTTVTRDGKTYRMTDYANTSAPGLSPDWFIDDPNYGQLMDTQKYAAAHPSGENSLTLPILLASGAAAGAGALGYGSMAGSAAEGIGGLAAGAGEVAGAGGIPSSTWSTAIGETGAFDLAGSAGTGLAGSTGLPAGAVGQAGFTVGAGMTAAQAAAAGAGGAGGLTGNAILDAILKPSTLLPIAGQVGSAIYGADAAGKAADAQVAASNAGIGEARRQYDTTRADTAPWMAAGSDAIKRLSVLTAPGGDLVRPFTMADRDADPVYQSGLQFGLDEGRAGINARAIAGGGYDSGATLKALTRFGNDYGSTKAEGAYNRFNADNTGIYNKLAGISGTGQNAVNTVTSAGTNASNNIINANSDIGNSRAASIVGGANSWNNAATGINQTMNNAESRKILEALLRNRSY